MKSVSEFKFLWRECGLSCAIFYLRYKIDLAIQRSGSRLRRNKRREDKLDKIFSALFMQAHSTTVLDGKKYIRVSDALLPQPLYLRPYSSDRSVFLQVLVNKEYKCVADIFNQFFRQPARNIVDCGSNIGLTSIYFSQCYPGARFVSVEPVKENLETLKLNFAAAGMTNFRIVEGGVWNEDGMLMLNDTFRDGKEWSYNLREAKSSESGIQAYSLLKIVSEFGEPVDILKIDVEGAEKVLFADARYAGSFLGKVKCIAMEIHDEFGCREQIYDMLAKANFFYYDIKDMTIAINRSYA